jgi:hypothetical protein
LTKALWISEKGGKFVAINNAKPKQDTVETKQTFLEEKQGALTGHGKI